MPLFRSHPFVVWMLGLAICFGLDPGLAQPPSETLRAFRQYSGAVQARTEAHWSTLRYPLLESDPDAQRRLKNGEVVTVPARQLDLVPHIDVPGGRVEHWFGEVWVPDATLARAMAGLEDYGNRRRYMQPVIINSRVLSHTGNEFRIYLRLRQKALLSAVFDVVQRILYLPHDATHLVIESKSESVREVPSEQSPRGTPAKDRGLIWALDDYWRLSEGDGGVYIECEALVLSRELPALIRWFAGGLIASASQKMLAGTLKAYVRIISDAQRVGPPQAEKVRGRNSGSVALLVSTQRP